MSDRRFVLLLDDKEIELTRAEAFALESSGYIQPASERATDDLWRFVPASPNTADDVLYVLEDFRR